MGSDWLSVGVAKIFETLIRAKDFFYDWGWLDQVKIDRPVIGIGNLSFGGTGKTPFAILVSEWLVAKGHQVSVITGSYGTQTKRPAMVDPVLGLEKYADEALVLSERLPSSHVFFGPRKWETLLYARNFDEATRSDIFVLDDALQHRQISYDLMFVLVDASKSIESLNLAPMGRARDRLHALGQANVVVLTNVHLVAQEQLQNWLGFLKGLKSQWGWDFEIIQCFTEAQIPEEFLPMDNIQKSEVKFLSVCGIANPDSFERTLNSLGFDVKHKLNFKDHHNYTQGEYNKIVRKMNELKKIL
jgi:tetraacyldisaccharide 4'-kinase